MKATIPDAILYKNISLDGSNIPFPPMPPGQGGPSGYGGIPPPMMGPRHGGFIPGPPMGSPGDIRLPPPPMIPPFNVPPPGFGFGGPPANAPSGDGAVIAAGPQLNAGSTINQETLHGPGLYVHL
uniref:Uncharacterized protein n=1 Tax=Timema cristinae TaxID=61476 RepID=A0A7R9CK07_TIMCR|nr:unnamed protein product [Timema cristinae]